MARADVWHDGELVPWDAARASVLSHAMQRGSLVFDVGPLREGVDGRPRLFRPREHVERLLRSAALVGLEVRFSAEELLAATIATARRSGALSGLVRWSAFIPTLEPDVVPRRAPARVTIAVITPEDAAGDGPSSPRPEALRVCIPTDVRKAGPEVFPPHAKVAASYLGPSLAKRAAIARGFDEVVLLDGRGDVAEAPTANVFAVRDGALWTPPLERVLPGITRDAVLRVAEALGLPAREAPMRPEDLRTADEAFLTASSYPVMPIASVDGAALGTSAPGPITAKVRAAIQACERGADPRFAWTVDVGPAP